MTDSDSPNPGAGEDQLPKTSKPATRALNAAGYHRLSQLTEATEDELLELHGMGPKAIRMLREALAERGLSFRKS